MNPVDNPNKHNNNAIFYFPPLNEFNPTLSKYNLKPSDLFKTCIFKYNIMPIDNSNK